MPRLSSKSPKPVPAPAPPTPAPALGLVCITADERYRFRAITRTRFLALSPEDRLQTLQTLYWDNLQRLHAILGYCYRVGIRLYRMTSALFPMSDSDEGEAALLSMKANLASIGPRAQRLGIRMLIHPDQFAVLNSPKENVRATSKIIVEKHARNLDLLGLPRSHWSPIILHGGYAGSPKDKSAAIERLITAISELSDSARSRLALENDEYNFSADEILSICRRAGVPMIFDNLHHAIYEKLEDPADPSIARTLAEARTTWHPPEWQLVHLSNGAKGPLDRYHSTYIREIPPAYRNISWIEVEARGKDAAIAHLAGTWNLTNEERKHTLPPEDSADTSDE